MSSTPQDKTDLLDGPAASAPSATLPAAPPEHAVRQRYVVGVFREPSNAYGVIAGLSPDPSEVLVLSDAALDGDIRPGVMDGGHVANDTLHASGALTSRLAATLLKFDSFALLSAQSWADTDHVHPSPGMQRLFKNLVHHLETGAAIVIIHTPGAEQQLRVSRALLEAKCDTLLTHEVSLTGCGAAPAPDRTEDCCGSCTTRSCGRIGPP